jgi:type IV pilus assembly protein PilB
MVFAPLRKKDIGSILVEQGIITKDQLKQAQRECELSGKSLSAVLVDLELIDEENLVSAKAFQVGLQYQDLSKIDFDESLRRIIPGDMARKFKLMPISKVGNVFTIAMIDPNNMVALDEVKAKTKLKPVVVLASQTGIEESIEKYYGGVAAGLKDLDRAVDDDTEDVSLDDVIDEDVDAGESHLAET